MSHWRRCEALKGREMAVATRSSRLTPKDRIALLDAVLARYEQEPETIAKALPEAAQILRRLTPAHETPYQDPVHRLTEDEEERRLRSYREKVALMKKGGQALSKEAAVEALEDVAALTESSLSVAMELAPEDWAKLVRLVIGQTPSSVKRNTTFAVRETLDGKPEKHVPVLRGVVLDLAGDRRLLSVTVTPRKVQDGQRLMRFVGIGRAGQPSSTSSRR